MKRGKGILFTLRFVFQQSPAYVGVSLLYFIVTGTMSAVHNVLIYYLIIDILDSGKPATWLLGVVIFLIAYSVATGAFCRWYEEIYSPSREERLVDDVKAVVLDRAARMDLQVYDSPDFYNNVVLNLEKSHEKMLEVMKLSMMTMGSALSIAMSLTIYIGIGMTYLGFMLVFVGISIQLSRIIASKQYARKKKLIPWERKRAYFSDLLLRRPGAQDVRLYKADRIFKSKYDNAVAYIRETVRKGGFGIALLGFAQGFVIEQMILHFGTMLYLAYEIIATARIGLAQFASAFKGVSVIADTLGLIFGRYLSQLYECGLFVESFREFMECVDNGDGGNNRNECECGDVVENDAKDPGGFSIRIEDVVFRYPGCENNVIDHLSLSVPEGKRVAIVGFNGAGKSTLVKLLLGLYIPQSGKVLLGGMPADLVRKENADRFGILFQNYNLYAVSVAHNIAMDVTYDKGQVERAMESSGFYLSGAELSDGLRSEITKEFSSQGLQLSGGQQQLLASGRLYYGERRFFILDEPSASLDPRMELEMNRRVWEMTEGLTTVIISHRLSMTKNADLICYMENGRIVEKGSHDELLAADGRYAKLWKTQAEKYQIL